MNILGLEVRPRTAIKRWTSRKDAGGQAAKTDRPAQKARAGLAPDKGGADHQPPQEVVYTENPYTTLPAHAFWRSAVGEPDPLDIQDLWVPKFPIAQDMNIVTAGSCFAQHISRAMQANGFSWFDGEPAPPLLSDESAKRFNYGVFSCRTGNIYTTRLLHQWAKWALGTETPSDEVWIEGDRFIDPFRPNIEPGGFASKDELFASREATLQGFREAVRKGKIFVFTLGLTEGWENLETGVSYPVCPGTIGGQYSPQLHGFKNYSYRMVRSELMDAIRLMRSANSSLRFLLTVSPVPLTATASGGHVLPATIYSKSTLRAVAGDIAASSGLIDYFPSYEIISSYPYGGRFYSANKRSVEAEGVAHVMKNFFAGLDKQDLPQTESEVQAKPPSQPRASDKSDDLVCEDEVLDYYNAN